MKTVYFVRHGRTTWNDRGNRYCGRSDLELTEAGMGQALRLAQLFEDVPLDVAFASPLQRAIATAFPISNRAGVSLHIDSRLQEIDFGNWEGLTQQEIESSDTLQWQRWVQDPAVTKAGGTGETGQEAVVRMQHFVEDVKSWPFQNVLVTSHNTVMRLFIAASLALPLASYRHFEMDNGDVWVMRIGEMGEMKWKPGISCAHRNSTTENAAAMTELR